MSGLLSWTTLDPVNNTIENIPSDVIVPIDPVNDSDCLNQFVVPEVMKELVTEFMNNFALTEIDQCRIDVFQRRVDLLADLDREIRQNDDDYEASYRSMR